MSNDKIYYINIKPYIHDLSFDEMIERFEKSGINIDINIKEPFQPFMLNFLKKYNYTFIEKTREAQNVDKILSKKIMHHLHVFFDKFNTNTNTNTNTKINTKIKSRTNKINVKNSRIRTRKIRNLLQPNT